MRAVPREQCFCGNTDELRCVPHCSLQFNDESEPRDGRVPGGLLDLPQHHELDERDLRPLEDAVSVDRCTYDSTVRAVPCGRQICQYADELRRMPHRAL